MANFGNIFNDGIPWGDDNQATIDDFNAICKPVDIIGYRKLAIEIAVDMISNSFAAVKWNSYKSGKIVKDKSHEQLNIAPNPTETSQDFMKRLARKMLLKHEALVVPNGTDELYLADGGFTRRFTSFNRVEYTNVKIQTFNAPRPRYVNNDAMYITLHNKQLIQFLNQYQKDVDALVRSAKSSYQSNKLKKYYIESDAFGSQATNDQQARNDLITANMKAFLTSSEGITVYGKPKGYAINQLQDHQLETAGDVRNLIQDVFTMTANAFHIPPEMMFGGSVNQIIIDNYIVNGVSPLIEAFNTSFNVYNYSTTELNKTTMVKADISKMRLTDLNTVGNFIQKVLPTGALTMGDVITKYLNLDEPPEDLKDVRLITKNYGTIDQFLNGDFVNSNPTVEQVDYEGEKDDKEEDNTETGENTDGN